MMCLLFIDHVGVVDEKSSNDDHDYDSIQITSKKQRLRTRVDYVKWSDAEVQAIKRF